MSWLTLTEPEDLLVLLRTVLEATPEDSTRSPTPDTVVEKEDDSSYKAHAQEYQMIIQNVAHLHVYISSCRYVYICRQATKIQGK